MNYGQMARSDPDPQYELWQDSAEPFNPDISEELPIRIRKCLFFNNSMSIFLNCKYRAIFQVIEVLFPIGETKKTNLVQDHIRFAFKQH
jgi:hypothetical protein